MRKQTPDRSKIIYGINPVVEALKGESKVAKIFISDKGGNKRLAAIAETASALGVKVTQMDARGLSSRAGSANHQGVVAELGSGFSYTDLDDILEGGDEKNMLLLVLDSIEDPQNLGTLIRSAVAAGADGIVITKDRAVGVTPTVVKASAGSTSHIRIAQVTNLSETLKKLKDSGLWVVGVENGESESIYDTDLVGNTAIVIGSEGSGIRRLVKKNCDIMTTIPMAEAIGSLNAAQAATVALFETRRQRSAKGLK